MVLPTYGSVADFKLFDGFTTPLRGINLSDIEFIIDSHPELFTAVAQAIETSDGSEASAITQLVTKFSDLAALIVAVSTGEDDVSEAAVTIKTWPLGLLSSAAFKVYELTTEGNASAKKSLMEVIRLLTSPADQMDQPNP